MFSHDSFRLSIPPHHIVIGCYFISWLPSIWLLSWPDRGELFVSLPLSLSPSLSLFIHPFISPPLPLSLSLSLSLTLHLHLPLLSLDHFRHFGAISFIICSIILLIVSHRSEPKPYIDIEPYLWQRGLYHRLMMAQKDVRTHHSSELEMDMMEDSAGHHRLSHEVVVEEEVEGHLENNGGGGGEREHIGPHSAAHDNEDLQLQDLDLDNHHDLHHRVLHHHDHHDHDLHHDNHHDHHHDIDTTQLFIHNTGTTSSPSKEEIRFYELVTDAFAVLSLCTFVTLCIIFG